VLAVFGLAALTTSLAYGDDQDNMQGTWKVTFAEVGTKKGKTEASTAVLKTLGVVIEGDKLTLIEGGNKEVVHFALDPASKHIDFFNFKNKKEKLYHGIYSFDGANLKLCWGPSGAPRPGDFSAHKRDRHRYYIIQK
jgi:uncharacterized protein (TIGR03067 family)